MRDQVAAIKQQAEPTAMRLGSVVTRPDGSERGQVTWFKGRGIDARHRMWEDDAYIIVRSPGCYTVGNALADWTVLPRSEWTRPERVRSAWLNWEYPTWLDEGDEPQGTDRLDWRLIEALVGEADFEEWTGDDWPDDLALWMLLGEWIDHRIAAARRLGAASARLDSGQPIAPPESHQNGRSDR